jgi:hypothetical protein
LLQQKASLGIGQHLERQPGQVAVRRQQHTLATAKGGDQLVENDGTQIRTGLPLRDRRRLWGFPPDVSVWAVARVHRDAVTEVGDH